VKWERAAQLKTGPGSCRSHQILRVSENSLNIPMARREHLENRLELRAYPEQRPRVVILPYWKGRHPDHYTASVLVMKRVSAGCPSWTSATLSASSSLHFSQTIAGESGAAPSIQDHLRYTLLRVRPTFVVESPINSEAVASLMAYKSQFADQEAE